MPITVELIEKNQAVWDPKAQKTKAKSKYIKNEYLLADSWYASAKNLNAVVA